jgi:hypothetical protein
METFQADFDEFITRTISADTFCVRQSWLMSRYYGNMPDVTPAMRPMVVVMRDRLFHAMIQDITTRQLGHPNPWGEFLKHESIFFCLTLLAHYLKV